MFCGLLLLWLSEWSFNFGALYFCVIGLFLWLWVVCWLLLVLGGFRSFWWVLLDLLCLLFFFFFGFCVLGFVFVWLLGSVGGLGWLFCFFFFVLVFILLGFVVVSGFVCLCFGWGLFFFLVGGGLFWLGFLLLFVGFWRGGLLRGLCCFWGVWLVLEVLFFLLFWLTCCMVFGVVVVWVGGFGSLGGCLSACCFAFVLA